MLPLVLLFLFLMPGSLRAQETGPRHRDHHAAAHGRSAHNHDAHEGHDHHGTAAEEPHVHDERCEHGAHAGEKGHAHAHGPQEPWERGAVVRSVRSDMLALLCGFGGVGVYGLFLRKRGQERGAVR